MKTNKNPLAAKVDGRQHLHVLAAAVTWQAVFVEIHDELIRFKKLCKRREAKESGHEATHCAVCMDAKDRNDDAIMIYKNVQRQAAQINAQTGVRDSQLAEKLQMVTQTNALLAARDQSTAPADSF